MCLHLAAVSPTAASPFPQRAWAGSWIAHDAGRGGHRAVPRLETVHTHSPRFRLEEVLYTASSQRVGPPPLNRTRRSAQEPHPAPRHPIPTRHLPGYHWSSGSVAQRSRVLARVRLPPLSREPRPRRDYCWQDIPASGYSICRKGDPSCIGSWVVPSIPTQRLPQDREPQGGGPTPMSSACCVSSPRSRSPSTCSRSWCRSSHWSRWSMIARRPARI